MPTPSKPNRPGAAIAALGLVAATALAGCSPTIRVEAPDKPIQIDLNIKIEQEVRVRVDREVQELLQEQPGIF